MFSYEAGVGVAFLLWIGYAILIIVELNSRFERNLNKIGQRLSWLSLTPKPAFHNDKELSLPRKILKYLLIICLALPLVFLSWLYVGLYIASIAYKTANNIGAPQSIKEMRWKMRNLDMTFDQIVIELMKAGSDDTQAFEAFKERIIQEMRDRDLT